MASGTYRGRVLSGISMALRGAVLALLLGTGGARAAGDPFTVTGVTVDATAATVTAARDAALAEGQRKAFRQLLERLAAPADYGRLPHLSDRDITPLVGGFEVQEERSSTSRYLATLTYSFRPNAIRSLLHASGIAFAEAQSRPILLVPLLKTSAGTALWDEPNPWRRAWLDKPPGAGLVPFIVPTGEVEDVAALSTEQAVAGAPASFEPLLRRYDAGEAMVAQADLDPAGLVLSLRRPGIAEPIFTDRLAQAPAEAPADLLRRGAVRITQALDERWKRDILVQPQDDATGLFVRVPLRGLNDWLEVRRRLEATGFVQAVALKSLSRHEAIVGLRFAGDASQLKLVLAQRQLALDEAPDGWVLHVQGVGEPQTGDKPTGDKPIGAKPTGDKPNGERTSAF